MKKIIFINSIILLALFLFIRINVSNNLVFKKGIINKEDYEKIISSKRLYTDTLDLKYNNISIPYDKVNNYYLLSQIENKNYNGNISIDDFEIKVLKTNKNKNQIISKNENLILIAYNSGYYKIINLRMTHFPVIKLNNTNNKVILFDNDINRGILNVQEYAMSYHIRGASTSISTKPSYKLNILNSKGNKKKVSLLNMRTDDDWILNSMTNDKVYMLEKIGYNIWQGMSNYNIKLKYVELFIDDEYKGIYYLQEPADFKTYDANNKSLLVSVKSWESNITKPELFNENLNYNIIIDEFELDSKIEENKQIQLLRKYVSDVKNIAYSSEINLKYNIESIAKCSLFIDLISAVDNTYKNQKILFRYNNGDYFVEIYPWDLDWSQNNELFSHMFNFMDIIENKNVPSFYLEDEAYKKIMRDTYRNIRKTIYNKDYIFKLIDNNKFALEESGAILREQDIWGSRDLNKSTENLKKFYIEKINLLDNYYGVK